MAKKSKKSVELEHGVVPKTPKALKAFMANVQSVKDKGRLTAQLVLSYENFQDNPEQFTCRFSDVLNSIEQPYRRRIVIGEQWTKLDYNWIESAGTIIVENRGNGRSPTIPTPEERDEEKLKELEIAISKTSNVMPFTIPLGRFQTFWMREDSPIFLRCLHQEAQVNLIVICR